MLVLEHTPFGRQLYAIGGSERVALLAGIRVNLSKVLAFAGAGLLVGVAALFELSRSRRTNPLISARVLSGLSSGLSRRHDLSAWLLQHTWRSHRDRAPGGWFQWSQSAGATLIPLQPIFNGVVLILAVITAAAEGGQILKVAQPLEDGRQP